MSSLNENRRLYFSAALLLVLVYLFAGFYPFHLQTPSNKEQVNGAETAPNRGIQFRSPGIAYTEKAPSWLKDTISTSRIDVSLKIRTAGREQYGPARIFTISSDRSRRNLTIGQWGSNLSVRIRTPYTSANGTPAYTLKDVFASPEWHQIDIHVTSGYLEIRVDGDTTLIAGIPHRPFKTWDPEYRVAMGNELSGDQPWLGTIRKAVVRVGNRSFDYLAPGALRIPERFTAGNSHPGKFVPFVDDQYNRVTLRDWIINLAGFAPFGWLVVRWRRPRPGIILAITLSAGVSMTIEAGQLWVFSDRFPSTEDIIMNTLGAALGAWFARRSTQAIDRTTGHRRRPANGIDL